MGKSKCTPPNGPSKTGGISGTGRGSCPPSKPTPAPASPKK